MSRKKEHHNPKTRPDLTGEHKFGDAGQLISLFLFIIVWCGDSLFLQKTIMFNDVIPLYIHAPLGIVLLICSGYLAIKSINIVFGERRETPSVIRKGVYGIIRHPMYVSEILLYLGLICISISLAAIFVLILIIIFLYSISRYEEKLLLQRFGNDYQNYMNETSMWIPGWRRKK
ncbi:MAG: isoprenylcysteine carboxylmethyltransferase family protein [Candidatus Marinimicrobia bacterium]|nr:isoprenylcysteine carboxylmethyltransferase family protein [Candidatus Neomarinimicrobiota bacterium]